MIGAEAVTDHTSELQFDTEMVRRKVGKGEREPGSRSMAANSSSRGKIDDER